MPGARDEHENLGLTWVPLFGRSNPASTSLTLPNHALLDEPPERSPHVRRSHPRLLGQAIDRGLHIWPGVHPDRSCLHLAHRLRSSRAVSDEPHEQKALGRGLRSLPCVLERSRQKRVMKRECCHNPRQPSSDAADDSSPYAPCRRAATDRSRVTCETASTSWCAKSSKGPVRIAGEGLEPAGEEMGLLNPHSVSSCDVVHLMAFRSPETTWSAGDLEVPLPVGSRRRRLTGNSGARG